MLVRRDLGFSSLVCLVVVVLVVVFIVRRRWRQSVERNEEIKRLVASASEELARAEFEATEAYYYTVAATPSPRVSVSVPVPVPTSAPVPLSSPLKPQYQCAVCFCPTTTRCAKCKAVRYCSGKCQIVHWRQGHKYECRPYVPTNEVGSNSYKEQKDSQDHNDDVDAEAQQTATPAARFPENPHEVDTNSTSAGVTFENPETVKSTQVSPARKSTDLGNNNSHKKSNPSDENSHSTSSSWTDNASKDSPPGASSPHASAAAEDLNLKDDKDRAFGVFRNKNGTASTTITCKHVSQLTENPQSVRSGSKTSKLKVVDQVKPSKLSRQESLEGGNETNYKYSFKGLFPYDTFVKLYNWKKVELRPCGLKNCGNSCYANAVLQCLMYTPPLTAYFLEGLHSKACDKRGHCFTCEFESLVMKAKNGNSSLSPIRILTHIENIGSNLGHGKEEDAHEFLRYVIDALQSVCIKEARTKTLNSLEEETTLIGLTFGGHLRSKITCMKCGGKSEVHERMMDLTVEIEGNIRTLEEALNKFTCSEILDGENKYKCSRCKSYEKAKKKMTLLEAPNVLTIALKRFQSGKFGKLNKSIRFPEILDMAPYVSGTSDKSPIYRLYGVVVHVDTMNAAFSGHYVCYVKNFQNRWFKFDDSVVKEVDVEHVLTKGAYMLLYARCSPRAPRSSLIHQQDPRKLHKTAPSFTSRPWDASQQQIRHRSVEEESSSSSDNSGFFSDSTQRDINDNIFGEWEHDYWSNNRSGRNVNVNVNSSDSDTSSTSSYPSPLYSRLYGTNGEDVDCRCSSCSRVTNLDRLGVTFRTSAVSGKATTFL